MATLKSRRVLFITTSFPSRSSDPRGSHIRGLASAIAQLGWEVTVIAPGHPGALATERIGPVEVHRHNYWLPVGRRLAEGVGGIVPNLRARPSLAIQVPFLIVSQIVKAYAEARIHDIVHAHWVLPSGLAGLIAKKSHGVPLVVTSHGADVNPARPGSPYGRLVGRVAAGADRCTAVSDALRQRLESLGVSNALTVPLGVDLTRQPRREPDGQLRLLYVGSLIPRKSVDTLLEAFRSVEPRLKTVLLIVGDGPERRRLEKEAVACGDRVRFLGERPHEEVLDIMANSDVLVLPSRSEGRPVVVLEALSAGIPVVASSLPGINEIIEHGISGLTFRPTDSNELASHLESLARQPALQERLGNAGRQRLIDLNLTMEASARQFVSIYESLIPGDRSAFIERGRSS